MQTATHRPAAQTALTFEQTAPDTYNQLFNIVGDYVTHYRTDLTKHDREALQDYKGPFIYGYRATGTTLLKLHDNLSEYYKPGREPNEKDNEEVRSLIVYISGPLCNKYFLHYDGKQFKKITEEKSRAIYTAHVENLINKRERAQERERNNF
jgi:hypothetical protein